METPAHEAASCGKISKPREIVSNLHFTATFSLKDSWVSRGVQITYIVQTMSVDLEEAMINEWSEADNIVKQIDQLCFVAATNAYFNILGKMRKLDHLRQSNTLLKFVQWTSGLTRRNHLFILITCVNEYLYDKIHGNIWKYHIATKIIHIFIRTWTYISYIYISVTVWCYCKKKRFFVK